MEYITNSPEETEALGERLAQTLTPNYLRLSQAERERMEKQKEKGE